MALETSFTTITADELLDLARSKREAGYRATQILAVHNEDGTNDITYSFGKDNLLEYYQIKSVAPEESLPSISSIYLSVFPYENEAHDLFGVQIEGIAIDFEGAFYDLAQREPMSIISPELHAARQKAKKAAAAKAAKEAKAAASKAAREARAKAQEEGKDISDLEPKGRHALNESPQEDVSADGSHKADEANKVDKAEKANKALEDLDPEKAAKVRAALEKKKQREAEQALEKKLAAMDPDKAAKVRAALEAKKAGADARKEA